MDKSNLWSLRLGFSGKESSKIEKMGLQLFLEKSFSATFNNDIPSFLTAEPKTLEELKAVRESLQSASPEEKKIIVKNQIKNTVEFKKWWLTKMQEDEFPLREKMVGFWQNHFVVTSQKVKVNYFTFQHNAILRENAFSNFKELTKKIVKSNAMVRYLDNVDNKKDKINENLSRELLELFTLGIGNYSEEDIKNGARALAGLNLGEENAVYRRFLEDNNPKTYFGKTGNWKADDLVDIIFEQKNIPYLLTRKILKWFIYDTPNNDLVIYYGDYFRKVNFEIKPLLTKIFTEEYQKNNQGTKIKDPLLYIFQLINELQIQNFNQNTLLYFLKQQGMDIYNQVNVKGWDGGNSWLTSQIYLQRNTTSDLLCNGRSISRKVDETMTDEMAEETKIIKKVTAKINFDATGNNKKIINDLANRLLFTVSESTQKDMEKLLKYDFDPKEENANFAVLRLFNYITKLPEYQLI